MTRKETEVLTDDTEWVVLDKGNEECIGQQQRRQKEKRRKPQDHADAWCDDAENPGNKECV